MWSRAVTSTTLPLPAFVTFSSRNLRLADVDVGPGGFARVGLVFMSRCCGCSCLEFMPPPRSGLWSKKECNLPNGIDDVAAAFTKTFIAKPRNHADTRAAFAHH